LIRAVERRTHRRDPPAGAGHRPAAGVPRAELDLLLMLPDLEQSNLARYHCQALAEIDKRAERIGELWSYPQSRACCGEKTCLVRAIGNPCSSTIRGCVRSQVPRRPAGGWRSSRLFRIRLSVRDSRLGLSTPRLAWT
jgi:hypothetical protein